MGLFSRRRERRAEGEVQLDGQLLSAILGGSQVTREMALQVPTVSGGIDLIAGIVAGTPIRLYRDENGKAEEIKDDPRLKLLNDETGDTLNANEFWRAMIRDYYTGKGGYAYIHKERGKIRSLHYVDEARISIVKNNDAIFKDFAICVDGRSYRPFDFFRILRNTRDGATGVPITVESAKLIEVAWQTLVFEGYQIKKGGNKKGFLQSERKLGEQELQALREGFNRLYSSGTENAIVLNNGVRFQESSNTSVEMQLNESKQTNAREFARIFHIAPEVMEGKAAEADTASLARLAAIPLMVTIQCALNRDLLLEKEKGRLYWAFDTKELLRGDMASRFAAYKTALDANFMQIDEVRYAEDLEPLGLNWIKLGLQDVLYDPKTKRIYTPNTNQTGSMEESALSPLPPEDGDGTIEPRAGGNPNHGPDGRFTSGPGGPYRAPDRGGGGGAAAKSGGAGDNTVNLPDGKKKQRTYDPDDYENLTVGSAGNTTRTEVGGFEGKGKRDAHIKGHMKNVGAKSEREYQRKAIEFLSQPLGEDMEDMLLENGKRYRYNYRTNEFGVVNPSGNVSTYYKPDKKEKDWEEKVEKHGKRKR